MWPKLYKNSMRNVNQKHSEITRMTNISCNQQKKSSYFYIDSVRYVKIASEQQKINIDCNWSLLYLFHFVCVKVFCIKFYSLEATKLRNSPLTKAFGKILNKFQLFTFRDFSFHCVIFAIWELFCSFTSSKCVTFTSTMLWACKHPSAPKLANATE